jgi:hypothetical protein
MEPGTDACMRPLKIAAPKDRILATDLRHPLLKHLRLCVEATDYSIAQGGYLQRAAPLCKPPSDRLPTINHSAAKIIWLWQHHHCQ